MWNGRRLGAEEKQKRERSYQASWGDKHEYLLLFLLEAYFRLVFVFSYGEPDLWESLTQCVQSPGHVKA